MTDTYTYVPPPAKPGSPIKGYVGLSEAARCPLYP